MKVKNLGRKNGKKRLLSSCSTRYICRLEISGKFRSQLQVIGIGGTHSEPGESQLPEHGSKEIESDEI